MKPRTMKPQSLLLFAALAVLGGANALHAETLEAVLGRMDQAARTTRSISADFTRTEYIAIFGDSTKATGHMNLRRNGTETQGVVEFKTPDVYTAHFPGGGKFEKYLPAAKLLEIYDLGERGNMVDQYLLLGFANSTDELRKDYEVAMGGEETLNGRKATRIVLTPKSEKVREEIAKIELWIAEGQSTATQVKLSRPSRRGDADYYLFEYTGVKVNPDLPDSAFEFRAPSGTDRKEISL